MCGGYSAARDAVPEAVPYIHYTNIILLASGPSLQRAATCHREARIIAMQLSKAAEIQEELFEHILWHAAKRDVCPPALNKEEKHPVSAFILVCRYWASMKS